jgi:hypothetical protein
MSSARRAVFRSFAIQKRRSSRNSVWKTASRFGRGGSVPLVKAEVASQLRHRLRAGLTPESASQGFQKSFSILRGSQQVRRLDQASQLCCGDERHVVGSAPTNDDWLT